MLRLVVVNALCVTSWSWVRVSLMQRVDDACVVCNELELG